MMITSILWHRHCPCWIGFHDKVTSEPLLEENKRYILRANRSMGCGASAPSERAVIPQDNYKPDKNANVSPVGNAKGGVAAKEAAPGEVKHLPKRFSTIGKFRIPFTKRCIKRCVCSFTDCLMT